MLKSSSYHDALIESLADPIEAKQYLRAVIEDNPAGFLKALRNVAEARGAGRESVFRDLPGDGNPGLDTLSSILKGLGLRLSIESAHEPLLEAASDEPMEREQSYAHLGR